MLLVVEREVVERRGWVRDEEFVEATALAQIIPGAIIVNLSALLGYRLRGARGAVVAAAGVILPGFVAVLAIAYLYATFRDLTMIQRVFHGIAPAAVALLLALVVSLGRLVLRDRRDWAVGAGAALAAAVLGLHPIAVLVAGAGAGVLLYRR